MRIATQRFRNRPGFFAREAASQSVLRFTGARRFVDIGDLDLEAKPQIGKELAATRACRSQNDGRRVRFRTHGLEFILGQI